MKTTGIQYKIKTATEKEILFHLRECSDSFIPPLAERVSVNDYAQKIYEKSVTFEAWSDQLLVGFIAAYFNLNGSAFITNVSVLEKFGGYGIASRMLDMCIRYARKDNIQELALDVNKYNTVEIHLYKRFGFKVHEVNGDTLAMKRQI